MLKLQVSIASRFFSRAADKDNIRFDGVSSRKIVVLPNSSVAAWHPEPSFPYEQTKPLPEKTIEDQSLLSTVARSSNRWKNGPKNVDLKNIFYTTKHEWFTRTREERLRRVAAPPAKRN
ncbi:hypothetical protein DICVIV_10608 [Dictyocaulus viviparus]|uniref:Large ribosomal subunit protein mL42 n=1 Tax=Dictyocaulus viviparus TaxID=29172 RepID=A0A0D8XI23_DICVI|nr:hypothetical protein DICVIV_10608 [Dictyocaulus viviparus]